MGRENYYKPGSFYRIDDRTGFAVRAERTRKEWNGLVVWSRVWEPRQPQDFVKGVRDDQTVPEGRPRAAFSFVGPLQSTLSASVAAGGSAISVAAPFSANVGDKVGVMLNQDLGVMAYFTVTSVGASYGVTPPFPGGANSGNLVVNLSAPELSAASYGASNGG